MSMMLANRLKNLAQLTKGAVRDVRQVVNELVEVLAPRAKPQPSLVRVPIRNGARRAQSLRSPYTNSRRYFSSSSYRYAQPWILRNLGFKPTFFKPSSSLAFKLTAFRKPLLGGGPFPSGLYRNFVNLNARNFCTSGSCASREAVQNLTSSLRCMFNNGGDTVMSLKMNKKQNSSGLTYHGSMSQKEAEQTFKLARCESTDVQRLGSYVEFSLPKMELTFPTVTFMNSEILSSLEDELDVIKSQMDKTARSIQTIFEAYGSLPMEKGDHSVKVHFPNLDAEELEKFLVELGIDDGIVYTSEDAEAVIAAEEGYMSSSSMDLSDLLEETAPALLSMDSESDTESMDSNEYFPVLSSSSGFQYASPIEVSERSSPIIISHSEGSFSEVSMA